MKDRDYLIGLQHIEGLGPRTLNLLLRHFGKVETIWHLGRKQLESETNLKASFIEHFIERKKGLNLDRILENLEKKEIKTVTILDDDYPPNLREIYDPPSVIFYQGEWQVNDSRALGIVGSRRATVYGKKVAEKFGGDLASAGFTVVSGLARGIDSAAHRGCLASSGRTIAVLGSGVDVIYPRENAKLSMEIKEKGVLLSEFVPGSTPKPGNFPARNRIIAGLSLGVLIVEAAARSGALITADFALESGRDVYAIPGPIVSPNSKGTNNLIKQGAKLVDQVGDILEEFDLGNDKKEKSNVPKDRELDLTADEKLIFNALSWEPIGIEEIIQSTQWAPSQVQTALTLLELKGLVEQVPGKQFVRKNI